MTVLICNLIGVTNGKVYKGCTLETSMTHKAKYEFKDVDFGSLTKGFKKASDIIRMEKPNYILAPVSGSVPFIDMLNLVDRHFNLDAVMYIPNSSRFSNREELMSNWYTNFYGINQTNEPLKFMCVDEVLSGSSAVVGYKQFQKSIESLAKRKAEGLNGGYEDFERFRRKLNKQISYKILGFAEKNYRRNPEFTRIENDDLVHLIEFDDIPTIDNVALNPIRFDIDKSTARSNGRAVYLPNIDKFEITNQYMAFLEGFASYCGVDPSRVSPINLAKIESGLNLAKLK